MLDETLSLAEGLPPKSKILVVNYPIYLNAVEHEINALGFLATDYSAQALLDFYLPEKKMQVFGLNMLFLSSHPSEADISVECGNCSCIVESKNNAAQMALSLNQKRDPHPSGPIVLKPLNVEGGSGMGPTLVMANEMQGYTLSDIGTYLAYQGDLELVPVVDQGDALLNVYSVLQVEASRNPELSFALVEFLTSPEVQQLIGDYGVEAYGMQLFTPCAGEAL